MALQPYTIYKEGSPLNTAAQQRAANVYSTTLQRWLDRQKEAGGYFAGAEQPLTETVGMFQRGGGYGAGQMTLIEDELKRAKAEALANQVATGMSSGSLATATGLRVGSEATKAKLGVEDVRTQFLTQALQALSALRGQRAAQVSSLVEPTYAPYLGTMANLYGTYAQKTLGERQLALTEQAARSGGSSSSGEVAARRGVFNW